MGEELSKVPLETLTDSHWSADDAAGLDASDSEAITERGGGRLYDDPPLENVPLQIGAYRIKRLVGAGATGRIYLGYDPTLDREVAIKLLKVERFGRGRNSVHQQRLQREAKALARISHANVIRVYEVGLHEDQLFICMEFVEGKTLGEWSTSSERLGWRAIASVVMEAGDGLAAAHRAQLIHRDFKPDNVLVGSSGEVRVVDFGLARETHAVAVNEDEPCSFDDSFASQTLTQPGAVVGTPAYLAPECYTGMPADELSDQYAFCVVMWEILFGERPFRGQTKHAYVAAALEGKTVVTPGSRRVPQWFRRALERGLSPDREQRWPSMEVLLRVLRRDPHRRIRRALGWAGLVTVVACAGYFFGADPARQCTSDAASAKMSPYWGDVQRAGIEEAFDATGVSFAGDAGRIAIARIDSFVDEWVEAETHRCIAEKRREQTPELLAHRATCIEDHRATLRAVLETLGGLDASHVSRASNVLVLLSSPLDCDAAELLLSDAMVLEEGGARLSASRLRRELETIKAQRKAAMYAGMIPRAERVVAQSVELGAARLHVDAKIELAALQEEQEQVTEAEETLLDVYFEAGAMDYVDGATRAAIELMWLYVEHKKDYAKVREWGRHAEMLIERAVDADRYEASRLHRLAVVAMGEGALEEARALANRARLVIEGRFGADHHKLTALHGMLGVIAARIGDFATARDHFEHALRIDKRVQGPEHPDVGAMLTNLALVSRHLGDLEGAVEAAREAVSIYRAAHGDRHSRTLAAQEALASAAMASGDYDGAREQYEAVLTRRREMYGPGDERVASTLGNLATLESEQRNYGAAVELLERSLAIRRAKPTPHASAMAIDEINYGNALRFLGLPERSLGVLRGARERVRHLGAEHRLPWVVDLELAETMLSLGQDEQARSLLSRLRASPVMKRESTTNQGFLWFALARAVTATTGETAEGRGLAVRAEAAFSQRAVDRRELDEVREWLAALPPTPSG